MPSSTLWGREGRDSRGRRFWSKLWVGVGGGGSLAPVTSVKWRLNQISWKGPPSSGSRGLGILSEVPASMVTEQSPELLSGRGHASPVHCLLRAWHLTGGACGKNE